MTNRNIFRSARSRTHRILPIGTLMGLCTTFAASAQLPDPSASEQESGSELKAIVVTGSRIHGVGPVGSSVIGVSSDDIKNSGAINVFDALREIPQVSNLGVSEDSRSTNGGSGNITYGSSINLRGLGPFSTLTLLDGRRVVQAGSAGGLPDPSNYPVLGLERVEIVADGASAIYGSDAVAGVANLILRRHYEGVEAMLHYGVAEGYHVRQEGALFGHEWSTGQVTAAIEESYHTDLNGNRRSFYGANLSVRGGSDFRASQCSPANILSDTGASYAVPALVPNTHNLCDPLKSQDLIPSQRRTKFALTIDQTLVQGVALVADVTASERKFAFEAGETNATVGVPSTNAFYIPLPGDTGTQLVSTSFGGQAPRNSSNGSEQQVQATLGLTADLAHEFKLEASYTYGRDSALANYYGGINNDTLSAALASSDPAVAVNPYGVGASSSSTAISSSFNSYFGAPGVNTFQALEVKADGPVLRLPGGNVRLAVGGEFDYSRLVTGFIAGTIADPFSASVTASRKVGAGFGEVFVPVVGSENALPLIRSLVFDVAYRYEHYSDVGSTTNPKFGMNWIPMENWTIHGSYGKSFRAPLLSDIQAAGNALYVQPYATPTGVVQGVTLSGFNAGNPVSPERAKSYSLGADYQAQDAHKLTLSLNYFNIAYTNQTTSYLADLSLLSSASRAAQFSSLILTGNQAQNEVNALTAQGYPVIGVLPSPVNYFIYGQPVNLGITNTDGLDFATSIKLPTAAAGTFTAGLSGSYFLTYKVAVTPNAPLLNEAGHIFFPVRLRMRANAGYDRDRLSAMVYLNFTNSYVNDTVAPSQRISPYVTTDLHLAYAIPSDGTHTGFLSGLSIALDATNLFDRNPPFVNIAESPNGGGGFDPTTASPIGRLVGLSVNKKF